MRYCKSSACHSQTKRISEISSTKLYSKMTKNEAVQVNLIYLIFKLVHFLVDTSGLTFLVIYILSELVCFGKRTNHYPLAKIGIKLQICKKMREKLLISLVVLNFLATFAVEYET